MDSLIDPRQYMPDPARLAAIRARIDEYNAERPKIMRTAYFQVAVFMGIYAAFLLLVLFLLIRSENHSGTNPLSWILAASLLGGGYVWEFARSPVKELQRDLRYRLFPVIFGFIDEVRYSHGRTPGFLGEINRIKLVRHSGSVNDDLVGGLYDGLRFEMVKSRLTIQGGEGDDTVFRGLIFHFTRDEDFPGLLVTAKRGNRFQEWLHELFGSHKDTIGTGDPDVDATYEIHTDNYHAARPLVEGPLLSALNHLRRTWWTRDARLAFRGREVFLLLPTEHDYFALPPIQGGVDYNHHIEPIIHSMVSLLALARLIGKVGVAGG